MDKLNAQACSHRLRYLSALMVETAQSGHPGAPLGQADFLTVLFSQFLRITPEDTQWPNRDRFILSSGHACAGLYALYHSCGFDFSLKDLQSFRSLGSKTPGHPEYELPIEATTGPLSQGLAHAVGQAMAQKRLKKLCPEKAIDYKVYVTVGDGCLSEGLAQEALSLAGHLKLDNLIVLYDSNRITIDGDLDLSFSENIALRLESLGWNYAQADGHNFDQILEALKKATQNLGPQFIEFKTSIGKHLPTLEGSSQSHGAPIGLNELEKFMKKLCIEKQWSVPQEHYEFFNLKKKHSKELSLWKEKYAVKVDALLKKEALSTIPVFDHQEIKEATRKTFSKVLESWSQNEDLFIGGSCDLAASCYTNWPHKKNFDSDFAGNNIHFGVREHAAAAICNGIAATGLKPYCATFLVFSDFMLPAIRLSALSGHKVLYIFTHDSLAVGEDGPTHQPFEQLTHLRDIPGLKVFRPYNSFECSKALEEYSNGSGPVAVVLSRQSFVQKKSPTQPTLIEGMYPILEDSDSSVNLLSSGGDVALCLEAAKELRNKHGIKAQVYSVPCLEMLSKEKFLALQKEQEAQWFVVEASTAWHWTEIVPYQFIKAQRSFGQSGPGQKVLASKGFDPISISSFVSSKVSQLLEKV